LKSVEYVLRQPQAEATRAVPAVRVRPPNAWVLLYDLISSQIAIGELRKAVRLAWRAVRSPVSTLRWMGALERIRVRAGVETVPYVLARKAAQPFLHHSMPQAAAINLLTTHYERLLVKLGSEFVGRLLRGEVIVLAQIKGRSTVRYRLCLAQSFLNPREGELIVHLERVDEMKRVASLSLVVGAVDPGGPPDLWLGGLQGCRDADGKAVTVRATRDMWGLRPKDLLIHAAYALGDILGAASLKAISNAGHRRHSLKYELVGWHADYDAFWRELGGAPIAGDFFLLPKVRHRRSVEEVPPDKRSAWRARYALVDEIGADIRRLAVERGAG